MLSISERPQTFSEVFGAEIPKKVLATVVRKPELAPRAFILCGAYGSGKTSCARIFGKALNCVTGRKTGDACGVCPTCMSGDSSSYLELDAAIVGNVAAVRDLRDRLGYLCSSGYRVVVFDEVHLASGEAQSALLKVLEESPKGVFYIFSTTDADRLLDTIVSRSVVLNFSTLSNKTMAELLAKVATKEGINVPPDLEKYIIRRVGGHARDAMQQLDLLRILGEESFRSQAILLDEKFLRFFIALTKGELVAAEASARELCEFPVNDLTQDYEVFIKKLITKIYLDKDPQFVPLTKLVKFTLENHIYVKTSNDWYLFLMQAASLFEKQGQVTTNRWAK